MENNKDGSKNINMLIAGIELYEMSMSGKPYEEWLDDIIKKCNFKENENYFTKINDETKIRETGHQFLLDYKNLPAPISDIFAKFYLRNFLNYQMQKQKELKNRKKYFVAKK